MESLLIRVLLVIVIVAVKTRGIVTTSQYPISYNCTNSNGVCTEACNEAKGIKYSATFCESLSGCCFCDCRDIPSSSKCSRDVDSDCNLYCESKNPNPEVFTYIGTYCNVTVASAENPKTVCSCMCSLNSDYIESNDIDA